MSEPQSSLIPQSLIEFLLYDWLHIENLLDKPEFALHSRETISATLDTATRLSAEEFLTHYKLSDTKEPQLKDKGVEVLPEIAAALSKTAELGFFSASFSEEHDGLGMPTAAYAAMYAQLAAANISTAGYLMLTTANARLITAFGSQAQIQYFAGPQIEGRWFGTMCLSEPQAGSSLADIKTRAVKEEDDQCGSRYRLAGNKMWISGGDQNISENIVHLVLAKIPDENGAMPGGTKGLSLFIVPKILPDGTLNDIAVAGLNHKMGYRGTANCLLNFGENEGALGWRVGGVGDGLRQMFMMMNEARINVGLGAAALAMRGFQLSKAYASERIQGRRVDEKGGQPVAIIEHADVKHMLLQQKAFAEGALALCLYCSRLVDDAADDEDADSLLGLLTPVAKTWSSEFGLKANDIAIQIHGGYGYTRDFDVEQLYRDNRLNPIHEGTTGIQAIDLVGRKVLKDGGAALDLWRAEVLKTTEKARQNEAMAPLAARLERVLDAVFAAADRIMANETGWHVNATYFLRGFGHGVLAWIWLDLVCALHAGMPAHEASGRRHACRYFFDFELPSALHWLEHTASGAELALRIEAAEI